MGGFSNFRGSIFSDALGSRHAECEKVTSPSPFRLRPASSLTAYAVGEVKRSILQSFDDINNKYDDLTEINFLSGG